MKKPVMLVILDGWGLDWRKKGNAVKLAKTPTINFLEKGPKSILKASGLSVGLPDKQMGSSEVGHLNIGAGRIVHQELMKINNIIKDGSFFENPALKEIFSKNETVHLIGLVSDGGVHSHQDQLYSLIDFAKKYNCKVNVHAILDGRDTKPKSALGYITKLEKKLKGFGQIVTISGRFYAMDRDKRWQRTKKAYDIIALGAGIYHKSAADAVKESYKKNVTDEFVEPIVAGEYNGMKNDDAVVFFNFRPDRARQLTHAFIDKDFKAFSRKYVKTKFVTFVEYDRTLRHIKIAFPKEDYANILGEIVSKHHMKQLRIAETEKYAHVTYFFNGLVEKPYEGEDRILIPSPKVRTYDMKPEMSAFEVTETVIHKMDKYDFIVLNFANPDMVGHTGVLKAGIMAVEFVDSCLAKIVARIKELDGVLIVTADHGNCEEMLVEGENTCDTAHSTNPVPFYLFNYPAKLRRKGILADIAPTILDIMGIEKPKEMTGEDLIIKD